MRSVRQPARRLSANKVDPSVRPSALPPPPSLPGSVPLAAPRRRPGLAALSYYPKIGRNERQTDRQDRGQSGVWGAVGRGGAQGEGAALAPPRPASPCLPGRKAAGRQPAIRRAISRTQALPRFAALCREPLIANQRSAFRPTANQRPGLPFGRRGRDHRHYDVTAAYLLRDPSKSDPSGTSYAGSREERRV